MPNKNRFFCVLVALTFSCVAYEAEGAETVSLAPHTFTIAEGYELKRVAAPPLVQRPIHMYFDVDGVLYVTDSSGNTDKAPVQLKDPQHRVLELLRAKGFISVGHDEYWSLEMYDNAIKARDAGVSLAFFGGNSVLCVVPLLPSAMELQTETYAGKAGSCRCLRMSRRQPNKGF